MKVMSVDPVAPKLRLSEKVFLFLNLFFFFVFLFCAAAANAADVSYRVVRTIPAGGEAVGITSRSTRRPGGSTSRGARAFTS